MKFSPGTFNIRVRVVLTCARYAVVSVSAGKTKVMEAHPTGNQRNPRHLLAWEDMFAPEDAEVGEIMAANADAEEASNKPNKDIHPQSVKEFSRRGYDIEYERLPAPLRERAAQH